VRVAGIAVEVTSPKRPTIRLVVVDGGEVGVTITNAEEIPADNVETVEQLLHAARAVESRIKGLNIDRVVIRQAETQYASRKEGPRLRLLVEGAAAAAARAVVVDTRLGAGSDLGQWCGRSKADIDAEGKALIAAAGEHSRFGEAAAAALAGVAM
jgi:hypothetical protein